jgi:hypothetical protein
MVATLISSKGGLLDHDVPPISRQALNSSSQETGASIT